MSAIVLDGHLKSALSIVRSLGRRNIAVAAGAERETGMALHSKYAKGTFVYPSPNQNERVFLEIIEREAKRLGDMPVIYACSDATFLALYRSRDRLSSCATLVFPDPRAIEIAFDKAITQSLARVSNIPTITTYLPATPVELEKTARTIKYPAVVKPRKSLTFSQGKYHFGTAEFVHTKDELIRVYEKIKNTQGEAPLIQERIVGEEYGVEMIAHHGSTKSLVTHHRIRSLSPTGGASVLKETVQEGALRGMLEVYARKIVQELHWEGPIMVEFKVDGDTKTPLLMEVNGRFWGSLPLSIAAGIDMPYSYYYLATHGSFEKGEEMQVVGVTTRHFWGDVRHLLRVFFSRDKMRAHAYPSRLEALKLFFRAPEGTKGDVWAKDDPKPALMEVVDILKKLWS